MLEKFLHHKKEVQQFLLALAISESRVDGALWEKDNQGKVNILDVSQENYDLSDWETAITAADKVVTALETKLPENADLQKCVFGFFPEWVNEDKIKSECLNKIKQLTSRLSLTPLGFVDIPQAVSMHLGSAEGTQQTVILIGMEVKHYTVSLFKIGKLIATHTLERTLDAIADIDKAIDLFADIEVLPSRMLLYGTPENLEQIKADLLNHPWQKKANFLHFPKIEVLPNDFMIKAVVTSSSTEIALPVEKAEDKTVENETIAKPTVSDQGESQEISDIAQDLGFVTQSQPQVEKTTEIPEEKIISDENFALSEDQKQEISNVVPVTVPKKKLHIPTLPKFHLPKLTLTFKIPNFKASGIIIVVIGLLIILGGSVYAYSWFYPQAQITLLVTSKVFNTSEEILLDTKTTTVDVDQKILPASETSVEIKGSKQTTTTGKKTVGEKAKGEVTIYNKTQNTKLLKKSTVILSGNLKFTLDDDVSIASASENVGSLNYGSNKVNVTAYDIGTNYNVTSGTEFTVADLPSSYYSGRNEKAFAGGTSRQISVVDRNDQKTLREQALQELESQAVNEIKSKNQEGNKLLEGSIKTQIVKETYSKEIGEENDTLNLDLSIQATALVYKQNDLDELLGKIIQAQTPENYEYQKDQTKISVDELVKSNDGKNTYKVQIEAVLTPKVDYGNLASEITSKTCDEANKIIQAKFKITGADCSIQRSIFFMSKNLPINSKNISVKTSIVKL